jgi:hypothetical protein
VSRTPTGHRLELAGEFDHPHWLAFLCAGLSAQRFSVVSGRGRRDGRTWTADFEVVGDGPLLSDPVELAGRRPVTRDPAAPVLTSYALSRRADGLLRVELRAPDELGFLGRLLSRVSVLTLLPVELDIATVGGSVQDTIVLGGIGSGTLDDEVQGALDGMLRGFSA